MNEKPNRKTNELYVAFNNKKESLQKLIKQDQGSLTLKKKTASNLFRYLPDNSHKPQKKIEISDFTNILAIDTVHGILDVEGLTSYDKIVKFTLERGYLPSVAPELKHITVGGAIVGIGIESSGHKYGFVHDGLVEAEVLLPNGHIVVAKPDNEFSDLFFGLPNSYGTLGYILRAKIRLYRAQPFVHIQSQYFNSVKSFLDAMLEASQNDSINFVEGLIYSKQELYLLKSKFITSTSRTDDIYRQNIFYKIIRDKKDLYLTTYDYIFRYDPDWFWNIPDTFIYKFFRKWAPLSWRNSGFYKKYIDIKKRLLHKLGFSHKQKNKEEPLIQDWEVTWDKSETLLNFALEQIDLDGKPWAGIPIKPLHKATFYPLKTGQLYFNLGCYCYSKSQETSDPFYNTKLMDDLCFSLNGLKMLYSSTFLPETKFSELYNGTEYRRLKAKYDPKHHLKTLYEKVNRGS